MARNYTKKEYPFPTTENPHDGTERNNSPLDNRAVREYLVDNRFSNGVTGSYYDWPDWMRDVIRGATQQVGGSANISMSSLYYVIVSLDWIDVKRVKEYLNKKRHALGQPEYSLRHVQRITRAARCASDGIKHAAGLDNATVSDEQAPEPKYQYTPEEVRQLKYLSLHGQLSELLEYETSLKNKYTK